MAHLTPWLRQLIASELQSIIAWKSNISVQDDITRFTDDGSNFFTTVPTHRFSPDSKVQVVDVLSVNPATLLICDGATSARATLSNQALAQFEHAIDCLIEDDTTGDVFTILEAVVVSTTFGPPDSFIELRVEKLNYEYHLRKLVRDHKAVETYEQIRDLIVTDLTAIRQRHYAPDDQPMQKPAKAGASIEVGGRVSQIPRKESSQTMSQIETQVARPSPPSQAGKRTPLAASQFATQLPLQKRAGPILEVDGLEMESGVNLAAPRGANFEAATSRPSKTNGPVATVDPALLLQLLGGQKSIVPPIQTPATQATASKNVIEITNDAPISTPSRKRKSEDAPPSARPVSKLARTESSPSSSGRSGIREDIHSALNRAPTQDDSSPRPEVPSFAKSPSQARRPDAVAAPEYRHFHHQVPLDQQKLLDQPSSWFMNAKSQVANLPPALLKRFEQPIEAPSQKKQNGSTNEVPVPRYLQQPVSSIEGVNAKANSGATQYVTIDSASDSTSSSESEDSSSDDELLPWDPTQRSPAAKKDDMLPPDSTNENRNAQESQRRENGYVSRSERESIQCSQPSDAADSRLKTPQKANGLLSGRTAGTSSAHSSQRGELASRSRVNGSQRSAHPSESPRTPSANLRGVNGDYIAQFRGHSGGVSVSRSGGSYCSQPSQPATMNEDALRTPSDTLPVRSRQGSITSTPPGSQSKRLRVGEWTHEDDVILLDSVRRGKNAMEISIDHLSERTPSSIRNRKRHLLGNSDASPEALASAHRKATDRWRSSIGPDATSPTPGLAGRILSPPPQLMSTTGLQHSSATRRSAQIIIPASSRTLAHPLPNRPYGTQFSTAPSGTIIKATPDRFTAADGSGYSGRRDGFVPTEINQSEDPSVHHRRERSKFFKKVMENKRMARLKAERQLQARGMAPEPLAAVPKSVFGEFAKACRNLGPTHHSAFHEERPQAMRARDKKRIDVLSWDL